MPSVFVLDLWSLPVMDTTFLSFMACTINQMLNLVGSFGITIYGLC